MPRPVRTKDVPPGPYTPAEFERYGLGPRIVNPTTDDPVSNDPAVLRAESELAIARAVYYDVAGQWKDATLRHQTASLLGNDRTCGIPTVHPSRSDRPTTITP